MEEGEAIATDLRECRSMLHRANLDQSDPIQPGSLKLLNWNISKGSKEFWQKDLRSMSIDKDFVILQEAVLDSGIKLQVKELMHESFSPGYTTASKTTGVLTYSKRKPLSECRLSVLEPWLRTPKATNITQFSIEGRHETLLVINVHVVNFSIGLIRFRDQMEQIRQVLMDHSGPAILAGDFNTWRSKRMEVVNDIAGRFAFVAVQLQLDNRKKFNGHALDHVFVRGLSVHNSEVKSVISSDHNPIAVELRL